MEMTQQKMLSQKKCADSAKNELIQQNCAVSVQVAEPAKSHNTLCQQNFLSQEVLLTQRIIAKSAHFADSSNFC